MAEEKPLTPGEIYDKITGGRGSDSLGEATHLTRKLADQLTERAGDVKKLSAEIGEGWQGAAGEAAAGAAMPLAKAAEADAENLARASAAIESQVTDFGTARNSVVPVSDTKPEMSDAQVVRAVLTGDTSAYDREVSESGDPPGSDHHTPGHISRGDGPGYVQGPGDSDSGGNGSGGRGSPDAAGPSGTTPGYADSDSTPDGTTSAPATRTPTGHEPAPPSDGTSTASFTPDTGPGPRTGSGPLGGSHSPYSESGAGGSRGSASYSGSPGAFGTGSRTGATPGGGYGSSGYGSGPRPGASSGSAYGPGRSSGLLPRAGSRTGAPVGAIRGSGGGSAASGRGMMPMGAGGGKGQDGDETHERKTPYYEETNELFGPDYRGTVPEVIGEARRQR